MRIRNTGSNTDKQLYSIHLTYCMILDSRWFHSFVGPMSLVVILSSISKRTLLHLMFENFLHVQGVGYLEHVRAWRGEPGGVAPTWRLTHFWSSVGAREIDQVSVLHSLKFLLKNENLSHGSNLSLGIRRSSGAVLFEQVSYTRVVLYIFLRIFLLRIRSL